MFALQSEFNLYGCPHIIIMVLCLPARLVIGFTPTTLDAVFATLSQQYLKLLVNSSLAGLIMTKPKVL